MRILPPLEMIGKPAAYMVRSFAMWAIFIKIEIGTGAAAGRSAGEAAQPVLVLSSIPNTLSLIVGKPAICSAYRLIWHTVFFRRLLPAGWIRIPNPCRLG